MNSDAHGMQIFYRKAYEAACRGTVPAQLSDQHFESWEDLEQALILLPTDEQRCDAVYGNWLMRLYNPGGRQLLNQRQHLVGDAALAANYLAELAQNANDAAGGETAELRVHIEGDWLLVANNGREVTPLNLIGLCDFFGHFERPIPGVRTIGRFGVGFKSSFRIADEIFVKTWNGEEGFCFRIPITRPEYQQSYPNSIVQTRVVDQLRSVGISVSSRVLSPEFAGYCTPEYHIGLPLVSEIVDRLCSGFDRGTLFCFHLNESARKEVNARIHEQEHRIYELCPLFLPCLRSIQIGSCRLRLIQHQGDGDTREECNMIAERVTVEFQKAGRRNANTRFWRLRNIAEKWQLAVHASLDEDRRFLLRLERDADEESSSVRDGAAYAFFPLNGVSWPLKIHLHIDLPPELSRRDWNHGDGPDSLEWRAVETQIRLAVRAFTAWLEAHPEHRHPDWGLEQIFERKPSTDDRWAQVLFDELCAQASKRRILRSLADGFVTSNGAKAIQLLPHSESRKAWREVLITIPQTPVSFVLVEADPRIPLIKDTLTPGEIGEVCLNVASANPENECVQRSVLTAMLACRTLSLKAIQDVFQVIHCAAPGGTRIPLTELVEQPAGAELTGAWHNTFSLLASWAGGAAWQNTTIAGLSLQRQFEKLSHPVFNPTWRELVTRFPDEAAWQIHGEYFWRTPRQPCPLACTETALATVRVPSSDGRWLPIMGLWLKGNTPVDCFGNLLKPWDRQSADPVRHDYTSKLDGWGMMAAWSAATKKSLRDKLPAEITKQLTENCERDAFAIVFNTAFDVSRNQLDEEWKALVREAETTAVRRFVTARQTEAGLCKMTLLSMQIPASGRAALSLLPNFANAPSWLTELAFKRIRLLGLQDNCTFSFITQEEWSKHKSDYARELLEQFHQWRTAKEPTGALFGLNELAASESRSNRRNWPVGLSTHKKRLLKELTCALPVGLNIGLVEQLNLLLLSKAEKLEDELLPPPLTKVPSLVEACTQPRSLQLEMPNILSTPIDRKQIPPAALKESVVRALIEAGKHRFFFTTQPLKLRWRQDGETFATLPAADYMVEGDKLIFAHSLPPSELEPYKNILRAYEDNALGSAEYRHDKDAGVSTYELFQKHRPVISQALVESRVRAFGYQERHILRELLQNAESAYASKQECALPPDPWFALSITRLPNAAGYQVLAKHEGRAFDEPDKHGNPRPDVNRIVMESAPIQNTEDEVGRFNRGFKSVFCVARDKRVRIESGGFNFEIQDLMLRFPQEPERNACLTDPVTKFTFEASREDVLALLGLEEPPTANTLLPLINASSLVFLRYICRVTIKFENHKWEWKTTPGRRDGWQEVAVDSCDRFPPEHFLVYHTPRTHPGGWFAAALRLDNQGLPKKLDQTWQCLRLTFETDEKLALNVLVNGQFEAEFGRRKLIKVPESGLVDKALDAVIQRCVQDFSGANATKERWLAWARCLDLKNRMAGLVEKAANVEVIKKRVAGFLTLHIPHAGSLKTSEELEFPSDLMRRLESDNYCGRWGIETSNWIDSEIAKQLPDAERDEFRLDDWLRNVQLPRQRLQEIQVAIETRQFGLIAAAFPAEFDKARQLLQLRLRPTRHLQREQWQIAELYQRWQEDNEKTNNRLIDEYTLEGPNWTLLFPGDNTPQEQRSSRLRSNLQAPLTDGGRLTWYRLFGLACLMSGAGHGRIKSLRDFWVKELEQSDRDFWNATAGTNTAGTKFTDATNALFGELAHRQANPNAQGEWADYWRHVFYDVRKVHELVWNQQFADTVLGLLMDIEHAALLPQFLRDGQLPGQPPWAGVLGQSAGAPLFFLTRELCRLGIGNSDELRPLAFFVCTPVRRAAERIGWLEPGASAQTDFRALARMSEKLYKRIADDTNVDADIREQMLNLYDIPLLHLGLNG